MEPGFPELESYRFGEAKVRLVKVFLGEMPDGKPYGIFEYTFYGSEADKELKDYNAKADPMRAIIGVDEISSLPQKRWNHGKEVDKLMDDVRKNRPADFMERLTQWAIKKVPKDQWRETNYDDYFTNKKTYRFPHTNEFVFKAKVLDVQWKNRPERFVMDVDLESAGAVGFWDRIFGK